MLAVVGGLELDVTDLEHPELAVATAVVADDQRDQVLRIGGLAAVADGSSRLLPCWTSS